MLGDLKGTLEVAEQALAYSVSNPEYACEAHHAMGGTLISLGQLDAARQHFEVAVSAYALEEPRRSPLGSDLGVFAHAWFAHALWLLGDEGAAIAQADEAIERARRLKDPYSETLALAYAALTHQMRGDVERVRACAAGAIELSDRYGFGYYGDWAHALNGWVRGLEDPHEGIRLIEAALDRLDRTRAQGRRPYYLSLLAEIHERAGDRARAATLIDAAIDMALARLDVWWLPVLYLRKSEFGPTAMRAVALRQALEAARAQNSHALEQRILASAAGLV
jgi:tetratricopeptide (TPR) repeat protein